MNKKLRVLSQFYWITQFGFSLVTPPLMCITLAIWLQKRFELGAWIILLGLFLGLGAAGCTFYSFAQRFAGRKKDKEPKQKEISFRNHE